jgi:hypothetical protein
MMHDRVQTSSIQVDYNTLLYGNALFESAKTTDLRAIDLLLLQVANLIIAKRVLAYFRDLCRARKAYT